MKYFLTFLGIAMLIWFVIMLQKWRRIILQSRSPFTSSQEKRRVRAYGFLIDVFSLGLIFTCVLIILISFSVIKV